MDLDKLKKTWHSAEIKSSIDESKINRMLNLRGQSALNRIQQYEEVGFITSIALIIFGVIMIVLARTMLKTVNDTIPIFITLSSIFLLIWNIYKKYFFKKIDVSTMSIFSVAKAINTYKKYLAIEGVVAFIWTVSFAISFIFIQFSHLNILEKIILVFFICIFNTAISFLTYKFTIVKDLKTIVRAIEEAKEFERENIE